jgi:hypothetical protein
MKGPDKGGYLPAGPPWPLRFHAPELAQRCVSGILEEGPFFPNERRGDTVDDVLLVEHQPEAHTSPTQLIEIPSRVDADHHRREEQETDPCEQHQKDGPCEDHHVGANASQQ